MAGLDELRDKLEQHLMIFGPVNGRLALALDQLTDALVLVGQHGVYCQSARQPGKPAMDIQMILHSLTLAKELLQTAMEKVRDPKPSTQAGTAL